MHDIDTAAPVAILGTEAVSVFFPNGDALGRTLRIGDTPVQVVGILKERVFRFRDGQRNIFRWRNRIIAMPTTLVARRFEGDQYHRVDRVTFRIREARRHGQVLEGASRAMLKANHRQQEDFRLDDVGARVSKEQSQGDVYDIIFLLSGFLSLIGGGIVNVNIQMATLKERIREVGVKMAIGAPGREVFKEFMTEALLLTARGLARGPPHRRRLLEDHHGLDRRPPPHRPEELRLGIPARRRLRLRVRAVPGVEGLAPLADGGAAL